MTKISIHYTGDIVTKKEAIELSLSRYFTGKPCKHGHIAERCTKNRTCLQCLSKNSKKYRDNSGYRDNNKIYYKEYLRNWQKLNIDKRKVARQKRRTLLKQNTNNKIHFTDKDIIYIRELQNKKCANCEIKLNKKIEHIDHIIPLTLGGDNSKNNIQLLCATCNCKKRNKHPIDWAQENGRLL